MNEELLYIVKGQIVKLRNKDGLYKVLVVDADDRWIMLHDHNPNNPCDNPIITDCVFHNISDIEKIVQYAVERDIEHDIDQMIII